MLTPSAVQNAKPRAKPYKLTDERGMYLWVRPDGAKWWRFDYRRPGAAKRNTLSLGTFPETPLKRAREKREEARVLLAGGIDPGVQRQILRDAAADGFEAVAREWLGKQGHLSTVTLDKALAMFEQMAFPWIGSRPIAAITSPELLAVVRRVEGRGRIETAQRLKQRCGQVFRYAVATGRAERDLTADLRGALTTVKVRHRAAITDPDKFAELLRDLDSYGGSFIVACALRLAPLLFVRPGELRHAEWAEMDLEAAEWRIPAAKMKMRREHIVPLSVQAVAILRELQPVTGHAAGLKPDAPRFLFPSSRSRLRPMSENTINAALRSLGYSKEQASGHGFRASASTMLHELGWASDVIERQLAHQERNAIKRAYDRAQHLPERRKLMQAWADHLDTLRAGKSKKVVPIRAA